MLFQSQNQGNSGYRGMVEDGDMVLCRVNAPLVSECFKFIKAGRKANIQGRDIGKGLIKTVEKMKATTVEALIKALDQWLGDETRKEQARKFPSEMRITQMQDRVDCVRCFCDGIRPEAPPSEVVAKINAVFTDASQPGGIRLSSIPNAKGLAAKRVFLLQLEMACVPHPMAKLAWEKIQEEHLLYVAMTRAIEELVYVS